MKGFVVIAFAVACGAAFCRARAQEVAFASAVNYEAEVNAPGDVISFLLTATDERLMNIEEGTLAWRNSGSQNVRDYATRMMIDQRVMLGYIKKMALLRGLILPERAGRECDKLAGLSGRKFDKVFIKMMIADREYDLELFSRAAESSDIEIRRFAKLYIPVLEEQLLQAKALRRID